jgi:hypothetical protein
VARARSTLNNRVRAWSTFNGVFSGRAGVIGGKVFACAPSTGRVIGASEGVVAKVLAAGALGKVIETEAAFQSKGGGEGRQARSLGNVLCLWAGDRDDDGRG